MHTFLTYLTIAALIATAIVLFTGIFSVIFEKKANPERSNKLMRWRIFLQALALALFAALLLLGRKGGN